MSRAPLLFLLSLAAATAALHAQTSALPAPVIFFPPVPPVYGAPVPNSVSTSFIFNGRPLTAPEELAEYVNEHFYPALGSRLFGRGLGEKLEARVEAYRVRRNAQINELLDLLAGLRFADRDVRERELRAFAAIQTPRIVVLEDEAEQLREALVHGPGLLKEIHWSADRRWHLGVTKFPSPASEQEAEFQVVRAAAFFESGFTPAQRGLLRELAIDLHAIAAAARTGFRPANIHPAAMFFGPETALFELPTAAPPELRAKVGIYNRDKLALKNELRSALNAHDRSSTSARTRAFAALAEKQWPDLNALDRLAEEIRTDLADLGDPPPPKLPPIPPELRRRIESYDEDRLAFLRELQNYIRNAPIISPEFPVFGTPEERAEWARQLRTRRAIRPREAVAEFLRDNHERALALRARYLAITADLAQAASKLVDPKTGAQVSPESLIRDLSVANQRFAAIGREEAIYENYKIAMIQPGLSPEQRRLLFGTALVNLAQPLPVGQFPPRAAMPTPGW